MLFTAHFALTHILCQAESSTACAWTNTHHLKEITHLNLWFKKRTLLSDLFCFVCQMTCLPTVYCKSHPCAVYLHMHMDKMWLHVWLCFIFWQRYVLNIIAFNREILHVKQLFDILSLYWKSFFLKKQKKLDKVVTKRCVPSVNKYVKAN